MKYTETLVTFSEIPDEICLCIDISNCPYHCPGCHSQYLWEDVGEELNSEVLDKLVDQNSGISCVCLMGGKEDEILELLHKSKFQCKGIKAAWYTGQKNIPNFPVLMHLDYVKVGPYIEELGPLTSKTTNQRLYKLDHAYAPRYAKKKDTSAPKVLMHDITCKFWKEDSN